MLTKMKSADKKLLLTKPALERQDRWQKKNLEIFA
jgi:hypothetical protein